MFFQAVQYFIFLFHSKNQHGVHSPFVYRFITRCLYTKVNANSIAEFKKIQKQVLLGKRINNANYSLKKATILMQLCQYFKPTAILEIEPSTDFTTSIVQASTTSARITPLENFTETAQIAQNQSYDLILFGGNCSKEEAIASFENCLLGTHNKTVFVIQAIYKNNERVALWEFIKAHPKVTVTVDVFECGIVFFRKEQEKEHFKIRV